MLYYLSYIVTIPLAIVSGLLCVGYTLALLWVKRQQRKQRAASGAGDNRVTKKVGIFHPYCNAGGGGERVLWSVIKCLEVNYPHLEVVVYTGDQTATPDEIIEKAKSNFEMDLLKRPTFVYLTTRKWVEAERYPFFTLLGQSLGSLVLGMEALSKCVPDYYLETMGYSFTFPLFKYLAGCKVGCYVHYPTISTDMLQTVASSSTSFNNRAFISRSPLLTRAKLVYYQLFARLYGAVGRMSDTVMVNSSWTYGHIVALWQVPEKTFLVYPPCSTSAFQELSLERKDRLVVTSVAQFRPEKDHSLQLRAFKHFLDRLDAEDAANSRLILVGSCRDAGDEARVDALKSESVTLGIQKQVKFKLNFSFERLLNILSMSNIGIHTMNKEHFGIGVVECMAAGLIMLAHNSGGPKMDIIKHNVTGFLASTVEEYSDALFKIVHMEEDELNVMRLKARENTNRFSEETFQETFLASVRSIFD